MGTQIKRGEKNYCKITRKNIQRSMMSLLCGVMRRSQLSLRQFSVITCVHSRAPSPPLQELKITFSSSSGPGGQNVNKVATKVDIRFHVGKSSWLNPAEKQLVSEKLSNHINKEGILVVKSDKTRSQALNQEDALRKLSEMISSALRPPEPRFTEEELERIKKGKARANKERLNNKKLRGDTKRDRGGPPL